MVNSTKAFLLDCFLDKGCGDVRIATQSAGQNKSLTQNNLSERCRLVWCRTFPALSARSRRSSKTESHELLRRPHFGHLRAAVREELRPSLYSEDLRCGVQDLQLLGAKLGERKLSSRTSALRVQKLCSLRCNLALNWQDSWGILWLICNGTPGLAKR